MNPIDEHAAPGEEAYLRWRQWYGVSLAMAWMTVAAAGVTGVQLVTLGRGRNWCQNTISTWTARRILAGLGVRLDVRDGGAFSRREQTVFIANHTSTLDFFVGTALGLPNTRAFLARKLALFAPVGVIGVMLGHFFTVPQQFTEERRRIFKRAAARLRASGDSVYLTPEGTRYMDGTGPFNRGAFHLALDLGVPIQPIFIEVPAAINPGKNLKTRPGTVIVRAGPLVETSGWRLETLPDHIAAVRQLYLDHPRGWVDQ
ncbi:MAG: lysophospholipid acyltransferase family protein [bacterium]